MVGFICFALTGSCYLISLGLVVSFDGLILRFLNLLIFSFFFGFNQSFQGSALSSSADASSLSFYLWSILHSLRSPKVRLLFICDHSGQSRWTFLWLQSTSDSTPFSFCKLTMDGFRVSPFRSFFPGSPGLPKDQRLCARFSLFSFLGAL